MALQDLQVVDVELHIEDGTHHFLTVPLNADVHTTVSQLIGVRNSPDIKI